MVLAMTLSVGTPPNLWNTAYDKDWTTLTNQGFTGNGTVTIDGIAWQVENYASAGSSSNFAIVNGPGSTTAGLKIQRASGVNGDLYNNVRTLALISTKVNTLIPNVMEYSDRVMLWARIGALQNAVANYESLIIAFEKNADDPTRPTLFSAHKGYNGASLVINASGYSGYSGAAGTPYGADFATNTSDDVLAIELISNTQAQIYSGVWSSGWPAPTALRRRSRVSIVNNVAFPDASGNDWGILLGLKTGNTNADATVGYITNVRLDCRKNF